MWLILVRAPPPDAQYWPGRRWLATIDAMSWPALGAYALSRIAASGGIVVAVLLALLVVCGLRRVITALTANQRYRFTTWRYGRWLAYLLLIGALLKVI